MSSVPLHRARLGALALGCGAWLAGCQEPTVGVRVVFPSALTLDGVGIGRRVLFVEGIDVDGRPILRGCTVVDL